MDVNNLGYIDIDQFKSYISVDTTLDTQDKKDAVIALADADGSLKIDFNEFAYFLSKSGWAINFYLD